MILAVTVMALLVVFMLAGVIPAPGGAQEVVFRTPVFVILLGVLSACLLACCRRRRLSAKGLGFLLTHLGIAVILAGALARFVAGQKTDVVVPVTAMHTIDELPVEEGEPIQLGFGLTATDFDVEFYEPFYRLYRPPEDDGEEDYEWEGDYRFSPEGVLDLGEHGTLEMDELRDSPDNWTRQHMLDDGWVLQMAPPMARHYEAQIRFKDAGGEVTDASLAVNHPAAHAGWRFYLMSYDSEAGRYVVLTARRDPGRLAVLAGIWMLMIGTAVLCWRKRGGEGSPERGC